jgi:hypothetical protein
MTAPLFEMEPVPLPPVEKLSADRRRTLRQHAQVEAGVHPLIGLRARPDLGTCGGCERRVLLGYHGRTYPKCEEHEITHGAGTDVRAWWPACERFVPASPAPLLDSPDAARWIPEESA